MVQSIPELLWVNWSGDQHLLPLLTYLPTSLAEIVETVSEVEAKGMKAHAFGSGWSFSDAPITPDAMVSTNGIARLLAVRGSNVQPIGPNLILPQALEGRHGLAVVEAGLKVNALYTALNGPGIQAALPTFGSSAGQSLAGVLGTASHGGDLSRPPLADWVHALHLVTERGRQLWIERATGGPFTDDNALGAAYPGIQILREDGVFNAAVAACGRMGIIYSMLLELVPFFYLKESRVQMPWSVVEQAARRGPSALKAAFQFESNPLHYLEIQRSLDRDYSSVFVTRRIKTSSTAIDPKPGPPGDAELAIDLLLHHSDWMGILIGNGDKTKLGHRLNGVSNTNIRAMMEYVYLKFLAPHQFQGPYWYVMDRGPGPFPVQSAEYAFDASSTDYLAFVDQVLRLAHNPQIPGLMSFRYAPKSNALLAITRFPTTVHIEISAPRGYDPNGPFFESVQEIAIEHGGVPHLGQWNTLSYQQMRAVFGASLLQWRQALTRVGSRSPKATFSNAFSQQRGLEPIGRDNLLLMG